MSIRWLHPNRPFAPAKWPFFYGWTILVVATLGILASIPGQTVGMSVFADVFIEVMGLTRTQLTTAYLLGTGLSGFLVPVAGKGFDRMGARPFFMLSAALLGLASAGIGGIDFSLKLLPTSLGSSPVAGVLVMTFGFFLIRFLGQGLVTMGARSMLSKWWDRKRGLTISLSGVAVSALFSSAPTFLFWELEALGWRGAWFANGIFLATFFPLLAYIFFRDNPEECGLEMDGPYRGGARSERNDDLIMRKEFTRPEALQTYSFWIVTILLGMQSAFATAFVFHVLDIGREAGVPEDSMVTVFVRSIPFAVGANLIAGWIIEHVRLRTVMVTQALAGAIFASGLLRLPDPHSLTITVAGMGVAWGCYPVLSSVTFARYFGRKHLGAISGVAMSFMIWGSALGPFLFALSKEYLGGYHVLIGIGLIAYACLAVGTLFARNPQRSIEIS